MQFARWNATRGTEQRSSVKRPQVLFFRYFVTRSTGDHYLGSKHLFSKGPLPSRVFHLAFLPFAAVTHRPEQAGNYRERAEAHEHEAATWSLLWHLSSGREDMDNELEELEMRLMEKAPGNHLPLSGRLRKAALGQAGEVRRLNETVSWLEETAAEELDEEEREYRGISSFFWPEEGVWRATHHVSYSPLFFKTHFPRHFDILLSH